MTKILLIEDDGAIARDILDSVELSSPKYEIKDAYSYSSAVGCWKEYSGDFDCIVLDLNINPNGLSDNLFEKYFPTHGISILLEICKTKIGDSIPTEDEVKKIWAKTIAYSGYIDNLREKKNEFPYFTSLTLIPKTGMSMNELIKQIENIANKK